ncbi:hypothetical protein SO694_00016154 [Aureococcus anophagefferens]|uniref:Glycosyltransferase 2-like domain-containing protein n=1 Tax=Aureococcus anophagefferens TaxID=44056 RepID=A0ABR1G1W2_AURAN
MDKGWEEVPHRDDVGVVLWDEAADLPRVRAVRRTRVNNAWVDAGVELTIAPGEALKAGRGAVAGGGWVKLRDVEALPSAVASASRREARVAEERDETAHPYAAFCDKTTRPTASDLKRCFPAGTAASDALVRWTCEARDNVLVRQIQDDRCRTFDGRGGGACPACAYGPVCKSNLHPDFNVRVIERYGAGKRQPIGVTKLDAPTVIRGRVSVVCATSPAKHWLHENLWRCFAGQDWGDLELVVLDGGGEPSPFFTEPFAATPRDAADADFLSRVEKPEDDDRIRYVHREAARLSVGDERNELLKHASGEFVAHFDDACVYAPGYVSAMVSHLKASDAQLVRLEAAVGWDPVSNAVRLHKALGFRPETFVHRKAPLRALAFDDADVGEDAGFTSLAVCHVLDDSAGMLFAHAKHSKKPAALLRAHDAQWRDAAPTFLDAVAPPLRRLLAAHRRFFTNWKFLHHASTKRAAPSPFSNAPAGAGKGCDIPNFKGSSLGRVPAGATFVSAPVESTGVSLEDDEPPPEPPARPAQPMDPIERARLRAARRLARKNATSEDEELAVLRRAAPPMPPVALEYGEADDDDDGFRIVEMASE